jgi:prefoldin subunit 5
MEIEADGSEDVQAKLDEFSAFVRHTLRPDYALLRQREQETRAEIAEYTELLTRLRGYNTCSSVISVEGFDLGYQAAFCDATIEDSSRAVIDLGLGVHVELTIEEALTFVSKRIEFLTVQVLQHRSSKAKKVLAHIHASEQMLDALSNELGKHC